MKKYINRDDERNLIKIYQQNKNSNNYSDSLKASHALEELLNAHSAYILKIAARQYQKCGKLVEFEDLVQAGNLGLIKAINNFNLDRKSINPNNNTVVTNPALLTYAHFPILAEMQTLFHHSTLIDVPAHTIRAIQFNVKNPGCNTEEVKALAKKAMMAESLTDYQIGMYETERKIKMPSRLIGTDSTFDDGIKNIYSPENINAINMLSEEEWKVVQLRFGLIENESGVISKSPYIAKVMNMPVTKVEKVLKRARRILGKNLVNNR